MAAPTQDDFNNLLQGLKDLTTSLGNSTKSQKESIKDFTRNSLGLSVQLGSLYKIQEAVSKAAQLQVAALRYNAETTRIFSTTLTKAPGFTNLNAGMAMLEAGLENNSENLGEFFARADLLGENINQLAFGLRDMKVTLGLNKTETALLAESVEDSAKTYGTSSSRLVDSLNKFGTTLAVLNRTSTGQNQAILDLTAATDRAAPGALQAVLQPLFGGGAESLGRLGVLGAQGEAAALMSGEGGLGAGRDLFDKIVSLRDQIVGTGQQAILGSQIFEQMTGFTLQQANMAETLRDVLDAQAGSPRLDAVLDDALGSLNSIMEELKTPLAILTVGILEGLGGIKEIMKNEVVRNLVKAAAATGVLIAISASMRLLTLLTKRSSLVWLAIFGILSAIMPGVTKMLDGIMQTAESTETTAKIAKKNEANRTLNLLEEYNKRHSATLNALIRQNSKSHLIPSLSERMALAQREKQNQLSDMMLKVLNDQAETMSRSKSSFTPNPTGVK